MSSRASMPVITTVDRESGSAAGGKAVRAVPCEPKRVRSRHRLRHERRKLAQAVHVAVAQTNPNPNQGYYETHCDRWLCKADTEDANPPGSPSDFSDQVTCVFGCKRHDLAKRTP